LLRVLIAFVLILSVGCRKDRDLTQYTVEDKTPRLATLVHMSDPKTVPQLQEGFHQLEANSWRWTQGSFSVLLRPPFASPKSGAVLHMKGLIPDVVFSKVGPLRLHARIGEIDLPVVTFSKAGDAYYETLVPATLLAADSLRVTFVLDKFLKPNALPGDGRELGLIVSEIGWETKK
jgi:hypothetical protein